MLFDFFLQKYDIITEYNLIQLKLSTQTKTTSIFSKKKSYSIVLTRSYISLVF